MTLIEKFLALDVDLGCMTIAYHDKSVVDFIGDMTPLNSIVFALTGTDSLHYCAVKKDGLSIDESPVYLVSPPDKEDTVIWVAKDFLDFLNLGILFGNFEFISHSRLYDEALIYENLKEMQSYNNEYGYDKEIKKPQVFSAIIFR